MSERRNYYPNMDLLRYALALGVMVAHYNELGGHDVPYPITSFESVGGFFALSGFLIYPSFEKHRALGDYLRRRARRILPPYFFIVLTCAVGLVFASPLPADLYFGSGGFWGYLGANLTFLNFLHPDLPGVFAGPEYLLPAVNGSLWTMKIEWCLYLSVPLVVWLVSRFRWNRRATAAAIAVLSIAYRLVLELLYERTGNPWLEVLSRQFFGQLSYFYMGVLIYLYRDAFKRRLLGWGIAGLVLYLCAGALPGGGTVVAPVAIAILVLAISLTERTPGLLRHRHNVSYEMYLFHFPAIQLLIFTGLNEGPEWASFGVMTAAVVGLSVGWNRAWLYLRKNNRKNLQAI